MNGRMAGLLALTLGEILVGIGLRNEALSERGMAEAYVRLKRCCDEERRMIQARFADFTAPAALSWRLEQRRLLSELSLRPEL